MSSFVKVQTEITDQELLVQALTIMGYANVESHPEALELVNAWGTGHGVSTAEVIVRAKDAKAKHEGGYNRSDFGFKRGPTGKFALEANDMDRRSYDSKWLAEVNASVGLPRSPAWRAGNTAAPHPRFATSRRRPAANGWSRSPSRANVSIPEGQHHHQRARTPDRSPAEAGLPPAGS